MGLKMGHWATNTSIPTLRNEAWGRVGKLYPTHVIPTTSNKWCHSVTSGDAKAFFIGLAPRHPLVIRNLFKPTIKGKPR